MDLMGLRRSLLMQALETGVEGMELIGTYTFQESWETDSTGNATHVFEEVLLPYLTDDNLGNVYVCEFIGNNALIQYRADCIVAFPSGVTYSGRVNTLRNNRSNWGQIGTNRSFYVSAGTVVKIYRLYDPE